MSKRKIPRMKPRPSADWLGLIFMIKDLIKYGYEAYKQIRDAINQIRKTFEENKKKIIKKRKTSKKRKATPKKKITKKGKTITKKKTDKKKKTTKTKT